MTSLHVTSNTVEDLSAIDSEGRYQYVTVLL